MINAKDVKVGAKFVGNVNKVRFEVVEIGPTSFWMYYPRRVALRNLETGEFFTYGLKALTLCDISLIN